MEFLPAIAILLALAGSFSCLNAVTLKRENSSGLTFFTLVTALAIVGLGLLGWRLAHASWQADWKSCVNNSERAHWLDFYSVAPTHFAACDGCRPPRPRMRIRRQP